MASRIEDYALIGDCETAALVARDGSIDWLCFPRFDSAACFAALLGSRDNGRWQIAPAGEVKSVKRRYREHTLIVETEFETDTGSVRLIDFMPPRDDVPDVVRIVEGLAGSVPMHMDLTIRFDYGSIVPWVRRSDGGLHAIAGPDSLHLHTDLEVHGQNQHSVAEFEVSAGDRRYCILRWQQSHLPEPVHEDPEESLQIAEQFWKDWTGRCSYHGDYREAVMRSLVTLKAMTYAPTGGLVAAPTTSLPEWIGGTRNWDYRYCWLRDATFTLYALMEGGYTGEAKAWREWLVRTVAGSPSDVQIMYGIDGKRHLTEIELPWLAGYEGSQPVRIGNAACKQHQLDVYGEVMDALHVARRNGLEPDENAWRVQLGMMTFLEENWKHADEGIWEVRGPRRHFTHSKVMAWVAADRAVKAVERHHLDGPVDRWRSLRDRIRKEVLEKGFDREINSFVQYYGCQHLDASLLMLPLVGFLPANDPRMLGTVAAIQDRLVRDGFVDRYATLPEVDGLPHGEGTFLPCSFWLADNLALQGRRDEARELFERILGLCNDVGLLAEEYDPEAKRLLGNFPQALSHLGLINTARNLSESGGPAEDRAEVD